MTRMIRISLLAVLLSAFLPACSFSRLYAQNVEQVRMKSGSVVEGYISEQLPGRYIEVRSTKATIVVSSDSLETKQIERIPLDSLSEEWKEWAEAGNKFIDDGGQKKLELVTLEFQGSRYPRVFLLEKGSIIKFLDLDPGKYRFNWGDMHCISKTRRPDNLFSGLKETLVLDDNTEVEGQIIEQYPGKDMKILTDGGEVLSFRSGQVKEIRTKQLTDGLDLWSQIQLLDKISVKGEKVPLVGFISLRKSGKELTMLFEDGHSRTVPLSNIVSYAKIPNSEYAAVYDTVLEDGEIRMNGTQAYFCTLEQKGPYLLLGEIVSAQVSTGTEICVEANLEDLSAQCTLVKAHIENVPLKEGKKQETMPIPVISYEDLVTSSLPMDREITPLGNIRLTFNVDEEGDYVLYIKGKEGYIIINVVK